MQLHSIIHYITYYPTTSEFVKAYDVRALDRLIAPSIAHSSVRFLNRTIARSGPSTFACPISVSIDRTFDRSLNLCDRERAHGRNPMWSFRMFRLYRIRRRSVEQLSPRSSDRSLARSPARFLPDHALDRLRVRAFAQSL